MIHDMFDNWNTYILLDLICLQIPTSPSRLLQESHGPMEGMVWLASACFAHLAEAVEALRSFVGFFRWIWGLKMGGI